MKPVQPPVELEYPPVNRQTGTTYTLTQNDNAQVVTLGSASSTTVTVPAGLGQGFNCLLIQIGAGAVTIAAGSGVTINNADSFDAIAAQYGSATLYAYAPNIFYLGGQLT